MGTNGYQSTLCINENVGVGKTATSYKLDVVDSINTDNMLYTRNGINVYGLNADYNSEGLLLGNNGQFDNNEVGLYLSNNGTMLIGGYGNDGFNNFTNYSICDNSINIDIINSKISLNKQTTIISNLIVSGSTYSSSFVKSGGTESQILMADGSVSNGIIGTDYVFRPMMYRNLEKDFTRWVGTPPTGSYIPQQTPMLLVSTGSDVNGTYVIIKNMPYVDDIVEHPNRWGVFDISNMNTGSYGQPLPMVITKVQYLWTYSGNTNVVKLWCNTTTPNPKPSNSPDIDLQTGHLMGVMTFQSYGLHIKNTIDFHDYTGDMKWVGANAMWKRSDGKYAALIGFSFWSQPTNYATCWHLYTADDPMSSWTDQTPMNGYIDAFTSALSGRTDINNISFRCVNPMPGETGKYWTICYGYTGNTFVGVYSLSFDEYMLDIQINSVSIESAYAITNPVNKYISTVYFDGQFLFEYNTGDMYPDGGATYILKSSSLNGQYKYHSTVFDFSVVDTMGQVNYNTGHYTPLVYNDEFYMFTEESCNISTTGNGSQLEVFLYKYDKNTGVWSYLTGPVFVAAHGEDIVWGSVFGTGWDWVSKHMGISSIMFQDNNKLYLTYGGLHITDGYQATMSYIDLEESQQPYSKLTNIKTSIPNSIYSGINTIGGNIFTGGGGVKSKYDSTVPYPADSGSKNTSFGIESLLNLTSGSKNTSIGWRAGQKVTSGNWNTLFGAGAGSNITGGNSNISIGTDSLAQNNTGSENVAIGHAVGNSGGGVFSYNTLIGFQVGENDSYPYTGNTAIGHRAGFNLRGNYNVMLGYAAGKYESGSNKLYIDAIDRGSSIGDTSNALLYGEFNSLSSNQLLKINANTIISGNTLIGTTTTVSEILRVDGNSNTLGVGLRNLAYFKSEAYESNGRRAEFSLFPQGETNKLFELFANQNSYSEGSPFIDGLVDRLRLGYYQFGGDNCSVDLLGPEIQYFARTHTFLDPDFNESMRITDSSNVLIGTSGDTGYRLNVSGTTILNGSLTTNGGTNINGILSVTGNTNIIGTLTATVKSFVIDHPTKENKKLQYGVLEGPEHSVYVRGKLINNNIIHLPDYWSGLVDENTITVNLTSIGKEQSIYVKDVNINQIEIGGDNINCYYTIFAERKDVDKLIVEFDKI